jgi:hypothetical protein
MKKPIRIKFVDFWDDFVPEQSLFYQLLSQRYEIELTDNPDYLFCSVFGDEHLSYDCVKIFYTGENQCPDFNLYDYAIGFERLTLGDRYFRLPIYYLYANDFAAMQAKHEAVSLDEKEHFCSFVYSNNNASPHREAFLNKLNEYQTVSSGGRYRNNVGGPVADKLQFQLTHKFSIAFENSSYPGYCTEKLVQSFAARTIPIYWGDEYVGDTFNEGAFINCHRFASWDEVVAEVKRIDSNDALYLQMLQTPALNRPHDDNREATLQRLTNFFSHIIDQPIDKATRYNRHYWGKRYNDRMRNYAKAYHYTPRGMADYLYKKYFWKHRRKGILWKIDRLIKRKA